MIPITDLTGKTQYIRSCTEEDIPIHFSKISKETADTPAKIFMEQMKKCVDDHTAFVINGSNCFLYYTRTKKRIAKGVAIFSDHQPILMLALFSGVFAKLDNETKKIDFWLHEGKEISEYKSITTMSSLKRVAIKKCPLVIRTDHLSKKLNALYAQKGLS